MSCRHADENAETVINTEITEIAEKTTCDGFLRDLCALCVDDRLCVLSALNGGYLPRKLRLEERPGAGEIELFVSRFDAQEKPIACGKRESRDVEDRMKRHRQAVEREHAEHRCERGRE